MKRYANRIAQQIRGKFHDELHRDGKKFKDTLIGMIRRQLPPFGGRPRDPQLNEVERLRAQEWSFRTIAKRQVPGFDSLSKEAQRWHIQDLMKRLHNRRRANRKTARKNSGR